jgi:hypothetical protein
MGCGMLPDHHVKTTQKLSCPGRFWYKDNTPINVYDKL